jgi:glyoxylase-like metal-dependent hydrolase (beta-lactamase superfamily II)
LLESKNKQAVITGDVFHHPCQIGRPRWAGSFDFSAEAASDMREKFLRRFAEIDTLIIGTHFSSPTAGWIKVDGDNFYFNT